MKKYILLLFLILGATLHSFALDFKFTYEGHTLTYTVIDEDAKTCKTKDGSYGYGYAGNIVWNDVIIPEYADGYKVIEIGKYGFCNCEGLTSVTIPNSVTSIRDQAFSGCTGLTSVTIGNSVTTIGKGAFEYCSSLTSVTIPNSVTSIRDQAFSGCTGLTSVTIPNSVTSIGNSAFSRCSGLTSVNIPNSVKSIGESAFSSCSGLTSVTIPNSVETIGKSAFSCCIGLTSINIPNSVTTIGDAAFTECIRLTSLTVPPSVTNLGDQCFEGCTLDPLVIQGDASDYYTCKGMGKDSHIFCLPPDYAGIKSSVSCKVTSYPFDMTCTPLLGGADFKFIFTDVDFLQEVQKQEYADSFDFLKDAKWEFKCNDQTFEIKNDCEYSIKGLQPNNCYHYEVSCTTPKIVLNATSEFLTKSPLIYLDYAYTTQTSIKDCLISCEKDESVTPTDITNIKATVGGKTYVYDGKSFDIKGLTPDTQYDICVYADYNGKTFSPSKKVRTRPVVRNDLSQVGPTSIAINVDIDPGDAEITDIFWTRDGQTYQEKSPVFTGLVPESTHSYNLTLVYSNDGRNTFSYTKTTSALELDILPTKCTTSTTAILGARTNISDYETNVGFQWKKYDAPASLNPSEAYAPVCDGMIEGYVKNLQPTSYYNVRAFYKDANDKYYFTDWQTFDPSDFSYFEPTVRTYAITQVNGNSVILRGYALQGTDDIVSQGFEYERTGDNASHITTKADTTGKIYATGQVMTATLTDLPDGQYTFRAFVETSAGYTYGDAQTFVIETDGVENVEADGIYDEPEIVGYFDLNGFMTDTPRKGFNIVVYSDGSARKMILK